MARAGGTGRGPEREVSAAFPVGEGGGTGEAVSEDGAQGEADEELRGVAAPALAVSVARRKSPAR